MTGIGLEQNLRLLRDIFELIHESVKILGHELWLTTNSISASAKFLIVNIVTSDAASCVSNHRFMTTKLTSKEMKLGIHKSTFTK